MLPATNLEMVMFLSSHHPFTDQNQTLLTFKIGQGSNAVFIEVKESFAIKFTGQRNRPKRDLHIKATCSKAVINS